MIGPIVERKSQSRPVIAPSLDKLGKQRGFPLAQRRTSPAVENRDRQIASSAQPASSSSSHENTRAFAPNSSDLYERDSVENERRVADMSDEERGRERAEIIARFGSGIGDLLKRVKESRTKTMSDAVNSVTTIGNDDDGLRVDTRPQTPPNDKTTRPTTPLSPSLRKPDTPSRPSSRMSRQLRFADVQPSDVHVYESQPSSPRRTLGLLPPPSDSQDTSPNDPPTVQLSFSDWSKKSPKQQSDLEGEPKEGTPEYIRRRYFPSAPSENSSLEWISAPAAPKSELGEASSQPPHARYDLQGKLVPPDQYASLPTHLGLHHHAGDEAGYTIDDMILLARSTVPSQRAVMLGALSGVIVGLRSSQNVEDGTIQGKIVAVAVEALSERGNVAVRAVDVIWEAVVFGADALYMQSRAGPIELDDQTPKLSQQDVPVSQLTKPSHEPTAELPKDVVSSLPILYLLPDITSHFNRPTLPPFTLRRLLQILHRVAVHSRSNCTAIVQTPGLIASCLQTFLLSPTNDDEGPEPLAIPLFTTLAQAERSLAELLISNRIPDSLLRFLAILPGNSSYPIHVATALLDHTIDLFHALALYGLFTSLPATMYEPLKQLSSLVSVQQSVSSSLTWKWLRLREAWITCARDPHSTTPPHDIVWAQIVGWDWADDTYAIWDILSTSSPLNLWAATWNNVASFLEGASVNSIRGGVEEKLVVSQRFGGGFRDGREKSVVDGAFESLLASLNQLRSTTDRARTTNLLKAVSQASEVLCSALRLLLALLPSSLPNPTSEDQIPFPLSTLTQTCQNLATHVLWQKLLLPADTARTAYPLLRPATALMHLELRVSRHLESTVLAKWFAQAVRVYSLLLPGDEEIGMWILRELDTLITSDFVKSLGWSSPSDGTVESCDIRTMTPFLRFAIQPRKDNSKEDGTESPHGGRIAPLSATSSSIATSTTQTLPPSAFLQHRLSESSYGLPISPAWLFVPLDELLRSGTSDAFTSLPPSWNASEVEVVRATLLLARIVETLCPDTQTLVGSVLSREEAVFACMKVLMLEHGQQDTSTEEVFRDPTVMRLMKTLLSPFQLTTRPSTPVILSHKEEAPLEATAQRFLGRATPFYQFYTDFVALYDSISFFEPLFAALLLPPLSMRYSLDYRKLLWKDYPHTLRSIRTEPHEILAGTLSEFLWPVEDDREMIASYLAPLTKDVLHGFMRVVAVHHIACNIWPDLRESDAGTGAPVTEGRARKLLQVLLAQGSPQAIKDVMLYEQQFGGDDVVLLPPRCCDGTLRPTYGQRRLEWVDKLCGEAAKMRVAPHFDLSR